MKRIALIAMGVCLAAALVVIAAEVRSVNTVGFAKKALLPAGGLELIGVPFTSFTSGGSTTLEDMLGTNQLTAASFYTSADRVLLWDRVGVTYNFFAIRSSDGKFHNANSAGAWAGPATNPVVNVGDGLWLWRYGAASTTNQVYLLGEVIDATNAVIPIYEGLNLISYPFSCEFDVNASTLTTNNGVIGGTFYTTADWILVWDPVGRTYHKWAVKASDGKWHYADSAATWAGGPVTNKIAVGEGFWYKRVTNAVLNWAESNPYLSNL